MHPIDAELKKFQESITLMIERAIRKTHEEWDRKCREELREIDRCTGPTVRGGSAK